MENTDWRFNRIVVGIDGSAGAARAASWAINLARRTGAEILAVHIGQPPVQDFASYGFVAPVPVADWQDEIRGLFYEEWCLPFRQSSVRYRTIFEEGSPGQQLIAIAEREGAGMIVTGSRGLGLLREAILGSVSHYVVQHADVPVVVVPPEHHVRVKVVQAEPAATPAALPSGVFS